MNILDAEKMLVKRLRQKALGYEASLDFAYGWISGLADVGVITRPDSAKLAKVHANHRNGDRRWSIGKNGELVEDKTADITD